VDSTWAAQAQREIMAKYEAIAAKREALIAGEPVETSSAPAALISSTAEKEIANPSAPHSLSFIAAVWGGQMTPRKLKPMIGRSVKGKQLNRETWIVCLDDLPVTARKKLAPTDTNSRQLAPTRQVPPGNR
jgi:hypothetical protein